MNQVEKLASKLRERLLDAQIDLDAPSGAGSTWWLDVRLGDQGIAVEWRPTMGFGISSTPSDAYGEGPDEFYDNLDDAFVRIVYVLENAARTEPPTALALKRLREARHISQVELADLMGVRQATVSKIERRQDMNVSTLRRFVEALGAVLEVTARFPDRTISIDLGRAEDLDDPERVPG